MVWAAARRLPRKAYLELEDQPANITPYTFKAVMQKNSNIPQHTELYLKLLGYKYQADKAKVRLNPGANQNNIWFLPWGMVFSLTNSLTASAKGWTIPQIPTLFGPLRIWTYPKILRSNKVKKAIPNNTHKQVTTLEIKWNNNNENS